MLNKNRIKAFSLLLSISLLASCSLKIGTPPEDEEAKSSIRAGINEYSSEDWQVRLSAVKKAAKHAESPYVKNVLLLMLLAADDYHPMVQIEAIKGLGKIRGSDSLMKLQEIAKTDTDMNVKRYALTALQEFELEENSDIFFAEINSRDWLIREASYLGLLRIRPADFQKKHTGIILKGMRDSSISVKIAVLNNIMIKDPLLYAEISGLVRNKKTGITLLKSALIAIKGYEIDQKTRGRLLQLLTHRNKDIRILSLQVLKMEDERENF